MQPYASKAATRPQATCASAAAAASARSLPAAISAMLLCMRRLVLRSSRTCIRQHTSAYVSIRQHTYSACGGLCCEVRAPPPGGATARTHEPSQPPPPPLPPPPPPARATARCRRRRLAVPYALSGLHFCTSRASKASKATRRERRACCAQCFVLLY